jgi:hypothetical protein
MVSYLSRRPRTRQSSFASSKIANLPNTFPQINRPTSPLDSMPCAAKDYLRWPERAEDLSGFFLDDAHPVRTCDWREADEGNWKVEARELLEN